MFLQHSIELNPGKTPFFNITKAIPEVSGEVFVPERLNGVNYNHLFLTMKSKELAYQQRRYDLDWLRVIAFGILICFHAAVAFLPKGLPMILNSESSDTLAMIVAFLHQFRLALLFFVSGCGVWFSLKLRDRRTFIAERTSRLIIPLVFGITVLVPIMVYFEKRHLGFEYTSFLHFYSLYFTEGTYPSGNLSWHQFWFLAYLYLFCLIGWPIFSWARSARGRDTINAFILRYRLRAFGIYWLIVPLLVIEIVLRPLFPGFRDLIHDWASFSHWFLIFLVGFLVGFLFALDRRLLNNAERLRFVSLMGACLASALLFGLFWQAEQVRLFPFEGKQIDVGALLLFCLLRICNVWCWILVCAGFAARYLNRPSRLLCALNKAVYPVFCLHLPVLVVLEFYVITLDWSIGVKFLTITHCAILLLYCAYHILRPITFIHPLIGMRSR